MADLAYRPGAAVPEARSFLARVAGLATPWRLFGLTVLFGIGLRLAGGVGQPVELATDFLHHYNAAVHLTEGRLPTYLIYKGPAYAPWGALGFILLGGNDYIHWLVWNSAFLFPLTALALFLLSRETLGANRFAVIPPLMLAVLPGYVHVARLTASENIVLFGVCLAVFGFLRALRSDRLLTAALGGACLGLSLLIKSLLALAAPFLGAAFIVRGRRAFPFIRLDFGARGRNLVRGAVFALTATAVVAPWSIYASSYVGKPVLSASYSDLALLAGNQPFGDDQWYLGTGKAHLLIPDFDEAATQRKNFAQYADYGLWYLRHHPQSLLRDFRHNFEAQFNYTGLLAERWILRLTEGGPTPYTTLGAERIVFFTILGLGCLGLIARGGATSGSAAATIRFVALYGMVFLPFVLVLGDERHRMAFMPIVMVLAGMYLQAAYRRGGAAGLASAPWDGVRTMAFATVRAVRETVRAPLRLPWASGAAAAALAVIVFAVDPGPARVGPETFVGGTVDVIDRGLLADPNPVIGWPRPREGGEDPYVAHFLVPAKAGTYRARAVYSAAQPVPLDIHVNGSLALSGVLNETTGGAWNTFAVRRDLGPVTLEDGLNEITLRESAAASPPYPNARHALPVSVRDVRTAVGDGGKLSLSHASDDLYRLHLFGMAPEEKIITRSEIIALDAPLRKGEPYHFRVPVQTEGDVTVKVWLLSYDGEGNRIREETFRRVMEDFFPALDFVPGRDIQYIQTQLTIWGNGWLNIGREIIIDAGQAPAGGEYRGPYIEEIELIRSAPASPELPAADTKEH